MGKPVSWLEAFQANTGDAAVGGQSAPMIVGLANGNILVVWEEDAAGTIGELGDADIIGKIYDQSGEVVVRDAFLVNTGRFADNEGDFDVAATNDGGFILAYVDNDDETPTASAVIWQRYDALGDEVDFKEIASENVAADFLANPQIAVNQDNNSSYVTFTDDVGADTDIRGVRLDEFGTIVTVEFDVGQNSSDVDQDGDSAILRNGNLVTVYEEDDAGVPTIELRVNGPGGGSLGPLQASNFDGTDVDPQVASLKNGGFVAVWNRTDDPVKGSISDIQYRVFDASGDPVSGVRNAAASTRLENEPDVVALPDGDFVIVWDDDTRDVTRARRYNPDGSPDGGRFTVANGNATSQDLGVTADGRILAAWHISGGEMFASIWDPREDKVHAGDYEDQPLNFVATDNVSAFAKGGLLVGTNAANVLVGSAREDTIRGGKGNDTIFGKGDDDTLLGGDGNDELIGGGGTNVFNGQKGRDRVSYADADKAVVANLASPEKNAGRANNDDFISIEELEGSSSDDTLKGDSNRNKLIGNEGEDLLVGLNGNDTLRGGDDADKLKGGRGDDILFGGDDADRFLFERNDGDDVVKDFEVGIDKFVVGKGASNLGDLDITQIGSDTLIEFANVTVVLEGILASDLSASDFIV